MATKTYMNGQFAYDGTTIDSESSDESSYMIKLGNVSPKEISRPQSTENKNLNYQQIILQAEKNSAVQVFEPENSYYVKLTLPRDKNFNFDYGLRLLNYNSEDGNVDLDSINSYELIKYITVFPIDPDSIGYNNVGLYQEKDNNGKWKTINNGEQEVPETYVGIVIDVNVNSDGQPDAGNINDDYLKDKILRHDITPSGQEKKVYEYFVRDNESWRKLGQETDYWINVMPLNHNRTEMSDEQAVFEFVFTPMYYNTTYNAIYLNLVPNSIDGDIQWRKKVNETTSNYYGRYIEDITKINCEIYKIKNKVDTKQSSWVNIGVWGRSELMMVINGVEIKIGPSGYYELRDYDITSFGIVAKDYNDKFTVDYQYLSNS